MSDNFDIRTAAGGSDVTTFDYDKWCHEIFSMVSTAKTSAILHVNRELLSLYWTIGQSIISQQKLQGWGRQIIPRLSHDLSRRFPGDKGFSERNLKYMKAFAENYPDFPWLKVDDGKFVQVSLAQITWYHHISLMSKVKDMSERAFYIHETALNGWSRNVMMKNIGRDYIHSHGRAVNNFDTTLDPPHSLMAKETFKDPYIFSFLNPLEKLRERDIERRMITKIKDFLLEMGRGFSFVGNQYPLVVDGDTYYIDILMYHLRLHCYVVIELKAGEFKPEYVSKLNFYISAIDEKVKMPEDKPTIGLLMCRSKSNEKARLALKGFTQPLGITQYETEKLLEDVISELPSIEEIEKELENE